MISGYTLQAVRQAGRQREAGRGGLQGGPLRPQRSSSLLLLCLSSLPRLLACMPSLPRLPPCPYARRYVEQTDIHVPHTTVQEALQFRWGWGAGP